LVVWITVASLLDRRSRDAAGQAPHFDASLDRMRRDADTLRRNAAAEDEAAANASAAAAGLHSLRQEDEDLSRQDDGGERSSVADRLREVGQDVQAASKRLADEQVRVTALRSDRDRLSQARALAVPVAEAARLRFETISGDYERSLESAGDCTEDALIAARARVSDAENNFQQVRATCGTVDNGVHK
jgi:hypothetical protein